MKAKRPVSVVWSVSAYAVAALVLCPVLVVAASWFLPIEGRHWEHLAQYVLPQLLIQTAGLLLGVTALSFVLGVSLAWLCSQYDFFGVSLLRRALILPFALPAYVSAFVYVGLLDYTGPLRTWCRALVGSDVWIPEVRSLPGAIVILSLALYPYVYVLASNAFISQGKSMGEAARSLGANPFQVFHRLALALARPWIAGGLCLIALEVLNDFGAVSILGVDTFTTAIYKVWYGFFSPQSAAQLASFLVLLAFAIYALEQNARKRRGYSSNSPHRSIARVRLRGPSGWGASSYCFTIFALACVVPLVQLGIWAIEHAARFLDPVLLQSLFHSLFLGTVTAFLACLAIGVVLLAQRYQPHPWLKRCKQLAYLGYGIPGSVLAIGVFLPLVRLDHLLVDTLESLFGYQGSLILTGSLFSVVIALTIRFLAVAGSSLDAGLERISLRLDESARLFGVYGWQQFVRVQSPLLRRSFAAAMLLVFVDVIKELPLTLMTRPFGWDTLSVNIYSLISEGEWQRASVPALLLVLIGLLPLAFFDAKGGQ